MSRSEIKIPVGVAKQDRGTRVKHIAKHMSGRADGQMNGGV